MTDKSKKQPWVTPELQKIQYTDELHDQIISQARAKARMPGKRAQ